VQILGLEVDDAPQVPTLDTRFLSPLWDCPHTSIHSSPQPDLDMIINTRHICWDQVSGDFLPIDLRSHHAPAQMLRIVDGYMKHPIPEPSPH
jgi:hypothetical protein